VLMLVGSKIPERHPRVRLNRLSANVSQVGFLLVLRLARYRGCIRVSFLNEIRAPARVPTIFETSNLDACVMAPGPWAAHKSPLGCLVATRAPSENVRIGNRLPVTAF
jgi:hypothetical protein